VTNLSGDAIFADQAGTLHLRKQQVALLCRQWMRTPFAIVVVMAFVAYCAGEHQPRWELWLWIGGTLASLFTRRAYAKYLLADAGVDPVRALPRLVGFAALAGAMVGLAPLLFFDQLEGDRRALLTMALVCWTGGGVASAAAYARAFYAFMAPALVPLGAVWALAGGLENLAIAALIALFALVQVAFVRDNERVVHESFAIRFQNQRLIEELERERAEVMRARDRAEAANNSKSRFLAAASHDLRQPLHALSLYSATLSLRAASTDEREIAERIGKALASLSALLDALLDVSKLDAGAVEVRPSQFNVRDLIERVEGEYRSLARAKGLDFRVASANAEVITDRLLLERVVRNLVDNAVKHTASGGITLAAERGERSVRIAVRDTGAGIPASERERIFEEFYQLGNPERDRAQGLGLGLAIVKRLIQLLGLELEVESIEARGSSFTVVVPMTDAGAVAVPEREAPRPVEAPAEAHFAGLGVLVIDDEAAIRDGMRTLLESLGCSVKACSGFGAALREIGADARAIDLMIVDLRLRDNENGIETVNRLRKRLGDVPALLVSGDTAPERLREAQASGLQLLHKPVLGKDLQNAMRAALAR
jgi:signal transduction histidine kinase/CheY-like chemotaxis protein